jgi:hypothetical protein
MFEYILMIYGMNFSNKPMAHFFTGLNLTIFSVISLRVIILIEPDDNFEDIFIKILCSITCLYLIFSYLLIKIKLKEILDLNARLKCQKILYFDNNSKLFCPSIIAIAVWLLLLTIGIINRLVNEKIESVLHDFFSEINLAIFAKSSDIFLVIVYSNGWKILVLLIYHDLNMKYSNIIEAFSEEMKRKVNYPEINVIRMTHRSVLKFMDLQTSLKKCVRFMKLFIIFDFAIHSLLNLILTLKSVLISDYYGFFLTLSYLIVWVSYHLWIRFEINSTKNNEKMLNFHSNRWQKITINDNCLIELQILERTIQLFIDF